MWVSLTSLIMCPALWSACKGKTFCIKWQISSQQALKYTTWCTRRIFVSYSQPIRFVRFHGKCYFVSKELHTREYGRLMMRVKRTRKKRKGCSKPNREQLYFLECSLNFLSALELHDTQLKAWMNCFVMLPTDTLHTQWPCTTLYSWMMTTILNFSLKRLCGRCCTFNISVASFLLICICSASSRSLSKISLCNIILTSILVNCVAVPPS